MQVAICYPDLRRGVKMRCFGSFRQAFSFVVLVVNDAWVLSHTLSLRIFDV